MTLVRVRARYFGDARWVVGPVTLVTPGWRSGPLPKKATFPLKIISQPGNLVTLGWGRARYFGDAPVGFGPVTLVTPVGSGPVTLVTPGWGSGQIPRQPARQPVSLLASRAASRPASFPISQPASLPVRLLASKPRHFLLAYVA